MATKKRKTARKKGTRKGKKKGAAKKAAAKKAAAKKAARKKAARKTSRPPKGSGSAGDVVVAGAKPDGAVVARTVARRRWRKEEVIERKYDPTAVEVDGRFKRAVRRWRIWLDRDLPPPRDYRPFSCLRVEVEIMPVRIKGIDYRSSYQYYLAEECRGDWPR
jgi:hypothetical protein